MPAPRSLLRLRLVLCGVLLGASATLSPPAHGLDYDRNDVRARELGLGTVLAPVAGRPLGLFVQGTARRHRRSIYLSTQLQLGALLGGLPWVHLAGAVGMETADDAWVRVRGYGELGTGIIFANTRLSDTLAFFGEVGVRYQIRAFARPHLLLHAGLRGMTNFSHAGVQAQVGVAWTFD